MAVRWGDEVGGWGDEVGGWRGGLGDLGVYDCYSLGDRTDHDAQAQVTGYGLEDARVGYDAVVQASHEGCLGWAYCSNVRVGVKGFWTSALFSNTTILSRGTQTHRIFED